MIDCIASDIGFNWIGFPFQDNLMATRPFQTGVAAGIIGYDPNFEPHTRARSNTWPCPRPEIIKEEVEEESPVDVLLNANSQQQHNALQLNQLQGPGPGPGLPGSGQQQLTSSSKQQQQQQQQPPPIPEYSSTTTTSNTSSPGQVGVGGVGGVGVGQLVKKSTSSRRNAWGNMSYADLITQAISSSPEKRLTLSQIYDWMVGNVPYFKDKGDSNSSAGWKNSIRHNLSLHNRFMRVQNEGTGKSSWWMLNPDAKPGKAARRRATSMETSKFEKKRGRIRKKLENLRNGVIDSPGSSLSEGLDIFPGPGTVDELVGAGGNYIGSSSNLSPDFRPRASSNASSCGRLSPIIRENVDLHDNQVPPMSPWGGDYYTPASSHYERYIAEEALAGNLANNMKLGEPLNSPEFSFHHSPGGSSEQNYTPQPQFRRGTLGENEYSPYTAYTSQAQNGTAGVNGGGGNGGGNHVVETKADLDFIEQLDTTFDCNVDEVLQNEISLGGEIDFNFGTLGAQQLLAHAHLQQQHQAQQSMMFNPSNSTLHHHLMSSPLMGSNGSALLTAGGGGNNPDVTVVTTSSPSGRPWVH